MRAKNLRWVSYLAVFVIAIFIGCATSKSAKPQPRATVPLGVETFQAAWEIMRDSHFDTNYNGQDWYRVREQFLPKVVAAKNVQEVRDTIQAMLDTLGESHLTIFPGSSPMRVSKMLSTNPPPASASTNVTQPQPAPLRESGSLGLEVRVLDSRLVAYRVAEGGPAARVGIQPGWIIEKIDGEPAVDPEILKTKADSGRLEFLLWHEAAGALKGPAGEKVKLDVVTNSGERKAVELTRGREPGQPAKLGNLPTMFTEFQPRELQSPGGKKVAYLQFNLWMLPAVAAVNRFVDENRNADAIVLDIRGNLGGIGGMVMGVAGHFVNERVSLGRMKLRENQLNFVAFPRRVDMQMRATNTFQGKLAILIDGLSLSSSEVFAGGMQEIGRARLFGERTGGQALPALADRLPNGDILYHAVADFTTPKGKRLEGNGVTPDEIVPLRLSALRAGKDEALDAAVKWIDSDGR